MAETFATEAWLDALWAQLRTDDAFRRAAASWVYGPWLIVVEAEADKQFPEGVAFEFDIHEGNARAVKLVDAANPARYPFAFAARFSRWKDLFGGKIDAIEAISQGRISFQGDLPAVTRHAEMVSALVAAAQRLDTSFQDEQPAPEPATANA